MTDTQLYELRKPESLRQAWGAAKLVLFLRPVIWVLQIYDDHWTSTFRGKPGIQEFARRARGDSPFDAPIPLPSIRRRTLTIPLPLIDSSHSTSFNIRRSRQRTDSQTTSLFLTKLPFDIRLIIYEEVLAGGDRRLVHILRKHRRLGHWRCRIQDGDDVWGLCESQQGRCVEGWLSYKEKMWRWDKAGRLILGTDSGIIPLLLTCRIVYSEAIQILYSKNIFHFYDPGDIRYFARCILPQRLDAIQYIMMDWERLFSIFNKDNTRPRFGNEEFKAWCQVWAIIGKMKSLLDLKVVLKSHKFQVPQARRLKMCLPMMEVKGLRKFEVIVPFEDETDWSFAADAPFVIVKGPERSGI